MMHQNDDEMPDAVKKLYEEMIEKALRDMLGNGTARQIYDNTFQPRPEEEFAMPFGDPNFRPYDPNPKSPGVDKPYLPEIDPVFFTRVLVAAGYRPYLLRRTDGQTQTVWSKSADLSKYAEGEATPIRMTNGMQVSRYAPVILVDAEDGGMLNEHGQQVQKVAKW
jgi:hypothetical protein